MFLRILGQVCVAVLLLLAAGCDLRMAVDVGLDGRGGGTIELSVAADAELVAEADAAGVDPFSRLEARVAALEGGAWDVTVEDLPDGGRQAVLTSGFDDPAGFDARWADLRQAMDVPEARLLGPMQLALDEEAATTTVSGELPLVVGEVTAADLGTTVEALTASLEGVAGTVLVVRSPGPLVGGAPGAEVQPVDPEDPEGPVVLTWTVAPGEVTPVQAVVAQPEDDLRGLLLTAGVAVLALALIAGGVVAQRRAAGR